MLKNQHSGRLTISRLCTSLAAGFAMLVCAAAQAPVSIPQFSLQKPGADIVGWKVEPFRKVAQRTQYSLVYDEALGQTVVSAKADAAAAPLVFRTDRDASAAPVLRWRWNVGNVIEKSDPTRREADDFAARIYVSFAHDPARTTLRERAENAMAKALYNEVPPRAALAYVFTHRGEINQVIESPYTTRVRSIVVDRSDQSIGQWVRFERDLVADYKRAFGEAPTRISGIAIMVDTDNTGQTATARFSDISLTEKQ